MLTRSKKETIDCILVVKSQGETLKFGITYNNVKTSVLEGWTQEPDWNVAEVILKLVNKWDAEYDLSLDGLRELEDERPGLLMAVIQGYHDARKGERVKNS